MVRFISLLGRAFAFAGISLSALLTHGMPTKTGSQDEAIVATVEEMLLASAQSFSGHITWYSGTQLDDPACGGSTPTDDSYVVAVPYGSIAKCWDWVKISYNGKSVNAQVVDRCEGCAVNGVDATKAVFSTLAPLTTGELNGATVSVSN